MRKINFLLATIMMLVGMTVQAATITVTWNASDIVTERPWDESFTKDGITFAPGMADFQNKNFGSGGTFTTASGKFTKIEVTAPYVDCSGTGWSGSNSKRTWTGEASSSVSYSEDIFDMGQGQLKIVFTIEMPNAATLFDLTLADGSDAHGTVAFTVDGAAATQAQKDDVVTVSVTPAEGYSTKVVTVRAYTTWAGAPARAKSRAAAPELKDDIDVTAGENGTWTFTMPEANVWVVVTYTKNLQDAWIEAIADQTYTGEAIEPTVTVKDGETTLTAGTDYTVAFSDNTNAGTATVTITAVEGSDYSGTATATFTIAKADITMTTAPAAVSDLTYSGEAQTLITAGTASFGTVLYSLDGTTYAEALPQATDAGAYTVYYKVEGDANHNAFEAQTVSVTIDAKALADPTVEVAEAGAGEVPAITVKDGETVLTEGTDYDITYKDSDEEEVTVAQMEANPGTYTAVISLKGNYSGSKEQTITVKATVVATLTIPAQSYATYYAAQGLNLDAATADGVKLCTVTGVNGSEVVLAELTEAAAETPLIIYNGTGDEQDVVLKVNETATTAETVATEFQGTLEAKEMPASGNGTDYYVLSNGHDFVWVKDAGTISANKCWLAISGSQAAGARRLSIVFSGETTGISAVSSAAGAADSIYDLSGRRVMQPAKGLYIVNGKKVVVK